MFKKFTAPALALLVFVGTLLIAPDAAAQLINEGDRIGAIDIATNGQTSFKGILRTIINYFLGFLGLIATIMIIVGGFYFITDGSGDGKEKGKSIIMYAAIGIIVVLISYALVNALLGAAGGAAPTV